MVKVEMCVASDNKPSRTVCERLGMTLEGVITNAEFIKEEYWTMPFMGFIVKKHNKAFKTDAASRAA